MRFYSDKGACCNDPGAKLTKRMGWHVNAGQVCAVTGVALIVVAWCVLDGWNSTVSKALFSLGVADGTEQSHGAPKYFDSPLFLTLAQCVFMSVAFSGLWWVSTESPSLDIARVRLTLSNAPWLVLVFSHIFGTFWLQALMMPTQVMSLSFFAASRALEVPVAAFLRSRAFGPALAPAMGGHRPRIVALMSVANLMLFYSYVRMEGCLCIWSGHGVWLAGASLYLVYFSLLTIPAMNVVCQEVMIAQFEVHPLLMLALQNMAATCVLLPALLQENVRTSLALLQEYPEVFLLTFWLCVQVAALAVVSVAMIWMLDSFWAVALRGMKAAYWWACQLVLFYATSNTLLSVAHPLKSGWTFFMLCGIAAAAAALSTDVRLTRPLKWKPSEMPVSNVKGFDI